MAIQIKLKNSVVQDSTPSTSDLPAVGEIALNANINSIGGFMRASDNSIVKIFGPGSVTTPTATTTVSGIAELATNTETTTGSATNRVVTPAGLKTVTDAERATSNTNYVAKAGSTLTGVLTMPNGSNNAPAINFGDSDSGIFGGTNTVSLAAGGTTRLTADTGVSVTGTLGVTGSMTLTGDLDVAADIRHIGDTNTRIRFPAVDAVSVETNGGEAFRVDNSRRLLIGHSSNFSISGSNPRFQITGETDSTAHGYVGIFSADNIGANFSLVKSRNATVGSQGLVQNDDVVGNINFVASDGNDTAHSVAKISAAIDGTASANDLPGRLVFSTTADGANSPTTRLTIDSAGTSTFSGDLTISNAQPRLNFSDSNNNPDYFIDGNAGALRFYDVTNQATRFQINSDGHVDVNGHLDVGADLDVTGTTTSNYLTLSAVNPTITFTDTNNNPDFKLEANSGQFKIIDSTNSADRLVVNTDGHVDIAGNLDVGAGIDVTGSINATTDITLASTSTGQKIEITKDGTSVAQLGHIGTGNEGFLALKDGGNNTVVLNGEAPSGNSYFNAGNVGIGTTSPTRKLEVHDTNATVLALNSTNSNGTTLRIQNGGTDKIFLGLAGDFITGQSNNVTDSAIRASGALLFATGGGNERMRIDSSGNVGIGTSSPSGKLNLATGASTACELRLTSNNTGSGSGDRGRISVHSSRNDGTAYEAGRIEIDRSSGTEDKSHMMFYTNNGSGSSERMRIDSSGKVGIGVSSPNYNLVVQGTGAQAMLVGSTNAASAAILIDGDSNGDGAGADYASITHTAAGALEINNRKSASIIFKNTSSETERMRITSDGKIGIGTASPGSQNVATNLVVGNTSSNNGVCILTGTNNDGVLSFNNANDTDLTGYIIYEHSSDSLRFGTTTSERMRIDSSGNVAIGTTSPDSDSAHHALTIAGKSGTGAGMISFVDTSGNKDGFIFADNGHLYFTADTSNATASSTIRFRVDGSSERARIDHVGRLLIGTTTPLINENGFNEIVLSGKSEGAAIHFSDANNNVQGGIFTSDLSSKMIVRTITNHPIEFRTNNTNQIHIDNSGNFNFQREAASNYPTQQIKWSNDSTTTNGFYIAQHSDRNGRIWHEQGLSIDFGTSNTERMRIHHDGNVGIGTTSPGHLLSISAANPVLEIEGTANSGDAALFLDAGANHWLVRADNSASANTFSIKSGTPSSSTHRLLIDSAGNVGIGTTSPTAKLDVQGNIALTASDPKIFFNTGGSMISNANVANTLAFFSDGSNERVRISSDGFVSIGNTSAQGSRLFVDSSGVSQNTLRLKQSHSSALIQFNETTNTSYVGDGYKFHGSRSAGSNYNFMAFDSAHASTPDREFTIRGDGNAYADGTWNNNGADYAEFFESSTGSAIPVGTAVVLEDNKVRAATSSDAVGNIIGVVRPKEPGQASMTIGNTAWNKWQGKYLTDDFDRFILDEHNVINWTEADGTFHSYESHAIPSDVTVPSDAEILTEDVNGNKFTHYRLNPDYDSSKTYVPRSDRDEWIVVGLVGQVKVLKGQAVNDRWVKMKDVSDTVEEYFIR